MPLHLLGKKSWNVYNKDNIARVKRDESEARAKEEAEKQRADSADAQQRLAILREENLVAVEDGDHQNNSHRTWRGGEEYARPTDSCTGPSASLGHGDRSKRPRKHANENDTDYELRLARQNTNLADRATTGLQPEHDQCKHTHFNGPITDKAGHIDLFGGAQHLYQHQRSTVPGHHTPRAATAQIDQDEQNQDWLKTRSGMHSSHAVAVRGESGKRGENGSGSGGGSRDALWYASTRISAARTQTAAVEFEAPTYDLWGNDDPKRPQREAARLASIDPLVMMKQASKQVRELKKERQEFADQQKAEIQALKREQKRNTENRRSRNERDDETRGSSRSRFDNKEEEKSQSERDHSPKRRHRKRHDGHGHGHRDRHRHSGSHSRSQVHGHGLRQSHTHSHEKRPDLRMNDDENPQKDQRSLLSHRHSRSDARLHRHQSDSPGERGGDGQRKDHEERGRREKKHEDGQYHERSRDDRRYRQRHGHQEGGRKEREVEYRCDIDQNKSRKSQRSSHTRRRSRSPAI